MSAYCYQCRKTWCICRTIEQEEAWASDEREKAEETARIYAEAAAAGIDPATWKPYEPRLVDGPEWDDVERQRAERWEQQLRDHRED